jgi:hypothetical protein
MQQAISQATSSEAKAALQNIQARLPESSTAISITRDLTSYTITNKEKTDTIVDKTKINLVITVRTELTNVTIIETIPKSVALDISAILFPGETPTILQADPIVSWTFPSIKPGETKDMSYIVTGKIDSLDSTTVAGGTKTSAVTPIPTPTPTPTPQPAQADLTSIILILALVVIIAVAIFMLGKGKGKEKGKKWSAYKAKVKALLPFLPI